MRKKFPLTLLTVNESRYLTQYAFMKSIDFIQLNRNDWLIEYHGGNYRSQ